MQKEMSCIKRIVMLAYIFILGANVLFSDTILQLVKKMYNGDNKYILVGDYTFKDIDNAIKNLKEKNIKQISEQDSEHLTALHYLVMMDDSEDTVEKLLKKYKDESDYSSFIDQEFPSDKNGYSSVTPFFYSVLFKKYKLAKILLNNGADINKTAINVSENSKESPLLLAVTAQEQSMIDLLLSNSKIKVNLPIEPIRGKGNTLTPLFMALWNDDTTTVKKLLAKKANPDFLATFRRKDKNGTEWTYSNWTPLLEVSKSSDMLNIVDLLLKHGADVKIGGKMDSAESHIENYTPLFSAIEMGDYQFFRKICERIPDISKEKMSVTGNNKIEYTPFMYAVTNKKINEEIVNYLLDANTIKEELLFPDGTKKTAGEILLARADISTALRNRANDIDTEVKIFEGIASNDYEAVHKALESKRNPNVRSGGKSAFETAVLKALDNNGDAQTRKIIKDLANYGAKINEDESNGKTMLAHIVDLSLDNGLNSTRRDLLALLLECGADSRCVIENQLPLVPYVAEKIGSSSNYELIDFFLDSAIADNENIEHKPSIEHQVVSGDYCNWNALCFAIKHDNADLAKYLISKDSNMDIVIKQDSNNVFTPLGLACKLGSKNCAETLLNLGASTTEKQEMFDSHNVTVFMAACSSMPWSIVKRLISDEEVNKLDSRGRNGFMYAAIYNDNPKTAQQAMRNLRGRKTDINRRTPSGDNALSLAINNNQNISNVMWLLENGVNFEKKIDSQTIDDNYGDSGDYYELLKELNSSN